jgi:hypothetical protein
MTDHIPNDLSHLSEAEFNALCPQGEHAPGLAMTWVPSNYSTERAQEFLDKFQEVYLASDDDKYVIATLLRMIALGPDLVDLTESDLLDLADAILQL